MSPRTPVPWYLRLLLRLFPAEEREFLLGDLEESGSRSWLTEIRGALALRFDRQRHHVAGTRAPTSGTGSPGAHPADAFPAGLHGKGLDTVDPNHAPAQGPSGFRHKGGNMLSDLILDLRFGLRMMMRNPGFTAVALVTMALGIGANTALFSMVHGVLLRPLPYPEPDRIVVLNESNFSKGWPTFSIAPENFLTWQARNHSFSTMATYTRQTVTHTADGIPRNRQAYIISDGFLEVMGGELALGRGFSEEEYDRGTQWVVILTHGFWEESFGADPDILGRSVTLDDRPFIVVGVLAEGWRPMTTSGAHVFIPIRPQEWWVGNRTSHMLKGVARLRPGVTPEQAQADLSAIAASLETEFPDSNEGWGAVVTPLLETVVGNVRLQLLILLVAVGLVLLIACANVSNMMLARANSRARELDIRAAIGAGRGRVIRQLLVESLLLFLMGGALGLLLAYAALGFFVDRWAFLLPRSDEIQLSGPVLLFTFGIALTTGLLAGLLPGFAARDTNLSDSLQEGTRSVAGDTTRRWVRKGFAIIYLTQGN